MRAELGQKACAVHKTVKFSNPQTSARRMLFFEVRTGKTNVFLANSFTLLDLCVSSWQGTHSINKTVKICNPQILELEKVKFA